jgi:hypothetical protein
VPAFQNPSLADIYSYRLQENNLDGEIPSVIGELPSLEQNRSLSYPALPHYTILRAWRGGFVSNDDSIRLPRSIKPELRTNLYGIARVRAGRPKQTVTKSVAWRKKVLCFTTAIAFRTLRRKRSFGTFKFERFVSINSIEIT